MKNLEVNVKRQFYTMASTSENTAEITMYGEIVENIPVDWWTGEKVEGQFIEEKAFLEDLKAIEGYDKVTIRMDSVGGDAGVSIVIHNRLRELARKGVELTCIVDGVAMSGGSLIMCACDNVQVNPSSLVMIHKCWGVMWGGYNADELRHEAESFDAIDKAQASIYMRKTGLEEREILSLMAETTYMTGKEAIEKGFADSLIEDAEPVAIAASADGRCLFVKNRKMHLASGLFAPDYIPTLNTEVSASAENKNKTEVTVGKEGGNHMTKEDLKAQYPDLIDEIVAEAKADGGSEAIKNAIKCEQKRMREIEEIASLYDDELVIEAKYGDSACSAQELAYRGAQRAAKEGKTFLAAMQEDSTESNTESVESATPPVELGEESEETAKASVKAFVHDLFSKEG